MWEENRSPEGVAGRDRGPSDFPPSSLTLNRRRCLSSPEIPLLTRSDHQKSGDFLTLGLSSYPASSHLEVEGDNREAVVPEERCKTKHAGIRSNETHDILQLQMCNPQQVRVALTFQFLT